MNEQLVRVINTLDSRIEEITNRMKDKTEFEEEVRENRFYEHNILLLKGLIEVRDSIKPFSTEKLSPSKKPTI